MAQSMTEAHPFDPLFGAGRRFLPPRQFQRQHDVFKHVHIGHQVKLLKHKGAGGAAMTGPLVFAQCAKSTAIKTYFTLGGCVESGE